MMTAMNAVLDEDRPAPVAADDVDDAVQAAKAAFPEWAAKTPRERAETLEHLSRRPDRVLGSIRLLHGHAESHHEAIARHVEDRAVVFERDLREEREVFVEERNHRIGAQGFGEPGEAAKVGHQDGGVDRVDRRLEIGCLSFRG